MHKAMLCSIFQETTLADELMEYSEECTQELLSIASWTEAAKECDIGERFEIYSQESRTEFGSS